MFEDHTVLVHLYSQNMCVKIPFRSNNFQMSRHTYLKHCKHQEQDVPSDTIRSCQNTSLRISTRSACILISGTYGAFLRVMMF